MKKLSIILAVVLLASCAGMGSDMSGARGRSGGTMGDANTSDTPHSMRTFDPNDPYHGG